MKKCTPLAENLKLINGSPDKLQSLPVMHLEKDGLELIFRGSIGCDEHFLRKHLAPKQEQNLLSFFRRRKAEDFHIKPAKQLGNGCAFSLMTSLHIVNLEKRRGQQKRTTRPVIPRDHIWPISLLRRSMRILKFLGADASKQHCTSASLQESEWEEFVSPSQVSRGESA